LRVTLRTRTATVATMDGLPDLRILGYDETAPHLRLLSLPEETIEPCPVSLNAADCALDRGFARDGWLVFDSNAEVWGVPIPLEGEAFRIGRWWDCVAAPNPRTVWLANPVDPDPNIGLDRDVPTLVVEYDGIRRQEILRHELPTSLRLEAAAADGLVLRPQNDDGNPDLDVLLLWTWRSASLEPLAPGRDLLASHGVLLAVGQRNGDLTLVDATTKTATPVEKPLPGAWGHAGSFSPDGAWFATGIGEEDSTTWYQDRLSENAIPPPGADVAEWYASRLRDPEYLRDAEQIASRLDEPQWTRLELIDCRTGAVTLSKDRFDNFATPPVWSQDCCWLIFDAPFGESLYACDVRKPSLELTPVVRRRRRLSPLIDVTAIAG
jgi:hypothetical protein